MRNCARGLDDQVVVGVMGRWARKLQWSGYHPTILSQIGSFFAFLA